MQPHARNHTELDPQTRAFYCRVLDILQRAEIPFLVGGAYALQFATGVERHTKDFDIFVPPVDAPRVLDLLAAAGCRTELTFPHWLGKAFGDDAFIDVIFSSGNGVAQVDDAWFANAPEGEVFGIPVRLCPVEEIIWSKAYIMERERYDGADVAHILRAQGERLDWQRLLKRFGPDWRVLFSHLLLFGFIYPGERAKIPEWVMAEMQRRLHAEMQSTPPACRLCQGTLLSREQYLIDIDEWGYQDARLTSRSAMSAEDVDKWTAGIDWSKTC